MDYLIENIEYNSEIIIFKKTEKEYSLKYRHQDIKMDPIEWNQGLISLTIINSNLIQKNLDTGPKLK